MRRAKEQQSPAAYHQPPLCPCLYAPSACQPCAPQDADAAYQAACDYTEPTCVIVKHTHPCGIASRGDLKEAYRLAVRADPISAFGGIVAFNRPLDAELAKEIREFRSPQVRALGC